jgi:hypothetical protein
MIIVQCDKCGKETKTPVCGRAELGFSRHWGKLVSPYITGTPRQGVEEYQLCPECIEEYIKTFKHE